MRTKKNSLVCENQILPFSFHFYALIWSLELNAGVDWRHLTNLTNWNVIAMKFDRPQIHCKSDVNVTVASPERVNKEVFKVIKQYSSFMSGITLSVHHGIKVTRKTLGGWLRCIWTAHKMCLSTKTNRTFPRVVYWVRNQFYFTIAFHSSHRTEMSR